jgi:hypothetical protein
MANQRGRKRKNDLYFGPQEEEAVVKFLECTDDYDRNLIYNKWLRKPFDKMIESIIRRYKLYRKCESFEDLHSDTLSFLITKADKFNKNSGSKAYSYYGTICKRYILGLLIKDEKTLKQIYSYDDIPQSSFEEMESMQYELDDGDFTLDKFIKNLMVTIQKEMDGGNTISKKKITDNERKVGYALIEILEDWETTLDLMAGGSKYNKNSVLETMRNYTGLSTKDIRLAMKRYKELYALIKMGGLEEGFEENPKP